MLLNKANFGCGGLEFCQRFGSACFIWKCSKLIFNNISNIYNFTPSRNWCEGFNIMTRILIMIGQKVSSNFALHIKNVCMTESRLPDACRTGFKKVLKLILSKSSLQILSKYNQKLLVTRIGWLGKGREDRKTLLTE